MTDRLICPPDAIRRAAKPGTANKKNVELNLPAQGSRNTASTPMLRTAAIVVALFAAFVWAFADSIGNLFHAWQSSAENSAGMIVPAAAAYMIAARKTSIFNWRLRFSFAGTAVFFLGLAANVGGNLLQYSSFENAGLVTCAIGLVWSLIGTHEVRRHVFPLLFLYLMCPLPHRIQDAATLPLQGMCAGVSASVLEMFGIPIDRFGHVLSVAGRKIAVAEACSGLRMATAFLIVTAVVTYLVRRPRWQKGVVLLSCIPIALACNVIRIATCALLYHQGYDRLAEGIFHDGTGLLMMPMALGMILLEFRLLSDLAMTEVFVPSLVETVERRRLAG